MRAVVAEGNRSGFNGAETERGEERGRSAGQEDAAFRGRLDERTQRRNDRFRKERGFNGNRVALVKPNDVERGEVDRLAGAGNDAGIGGNVQNGNRERRVGGVEVGRDLGDEVGLELHRDDRRLVENQRDPALRSGRVGERRERRY